MAKINTKITDGVHKFTLPIPYDTGSANCYLIEGDKGYTIIDTGANTEEAKWLWKMELEGKLPVEKVIITHIHPDHMGLASWFQERYGTPVWISTQGYEELLKMRSLFKDGQYEDPIRALSPYHGGPVLPKRKDLYFLYHDFLFEPDRLFSNHEKIPIGNDFYEAIWTPGHSPDHYCFYQHDKHILFVGDHILNDMNPIILTKQRGENPLKQYFATLDPLERLAADYVLPGHGQLIDDLRGRIGKMRAHYRKRLDQTFQSVDRKGKTAYEVAKSVYGSIQSHDRAMSAFIQVITNLEYLESIGCIKKEEELGKAFFILVMDEE